MADYIFPAYALIALATYLYITIADGTFKKIESNHPQDKHLTAFFLSVAFPLYFGIKVFSAIFPE